MEQVATIGLDIAKNVFQLHAKFRQHRAAGFHQAQVAQVITEPAAHQEFHGKIPETLNVLLAVTLLCPEHAVNKVIANGECERLEEFQRDHIAFRAGECVVNVPQNGLPQRLGLKRCSRQ